MQYHPGPALTSREMLFLASKLLKRLMMSLHGAIINAEVDDEAQVVVIAPVDHVLAHVGVGVLLRPEVGFPLKFRPESRRNVAPTSDGGMSANHLQQFHGRTAISAPPASSEDAMDNKSLSKMVT